MAAVSVIMATYNRAHTISRAINSLLKQTCSDWELIVIDDGSMDNTHQILQGFTDSRIRVLSHEPNRGVAFARNRGLDVMRGEWFTLLDSDDEMVPEALSTMLAIPGQIDSRINAITCNCIDSVSGGFTGLGLEHDQWLDLETLVTRCSGEHWGITKTCLLGNLRFSEALTWGESVLWYRLSRDACRYYIHKGLRIYHTEESDRLCGKPRLGNDRLEKKRVYYRQMAQEVDYLETLKRYRPADYANILVRVLFVYILDGRLKEARQITAENASVWSLKQRIAIRMAVMLGPRKLRAVLLLLTGYR